MKKSSMKLQNGFSRNDRITFSSSKYTVTAIRRSNGEIEYEKKETEKLSVSYVIYTLVGIFIFYIPHLCKSILMTHQMHKNKNLLIPYLIPMIIYFFITLLTILGTHTDKVLIKNHGAEHKVFNAYRKLKRIPTIEETKKFSRITFYCTSNLYPALFLAQIIGFFVQMHTGYRIPEILLFAIPHLKPGLFPLGYFVQLFTTQEPDDDAIALAIAAITELENTSKKKSL